MVEAVPDPPKFDGAAKATAVFRDAATHDAHFIHS
jgi:hypothetical protein